MRIGELSRRTGFSRDTIRFYERHGLISSLPSRELSNAYRDYPNDAVERLTMISEAREAGLSVADLQLLIRHMEARTDASFNAEAFFDHRIAEVSQSIERSRRFLKLLKQAKAALKAAAHDEPTR